uniref:Integral membrane protein GPR137C n=1 Tax=Pyxicephalus adspersus TaxID=30357 RepID=A0AAV2ZPP1_PYXAD|nr:TPA: hypothetical protein GDO54_005441 [Pyxicephalus adspersus]
MTATTISWPVELGLTVFTTGFCSLFFVVAYVQLWLLLHYRQKRLSYQSLLLFLCLLWSACRTVLFSFYLTNCAQANELQPFPHWLLYCAPICLQFFTLCLLNLYYSQVIFKARCSPEFNRCEISLHFGFFIIGLAFLIVNLSCIMIGNNGDDQRTTMIRVIFSECLFAVCSIFLINNTCRIANMSPAYVYLESKGTSGNQAVVTGILISILYILRASYNLVMISMQADNKPTPFSYSWNGEFDHTEVYDHRYYEIIRVLSVCSCFPAPSTVSFMCQQKCQEAAGMVNSHSFGSRAYFFDNPRRYDSDDDLPRLAGSRGERGSLSSTPKTSGWYGTICPTSGCALAPPLSDPSSGTPILFTCGGNTLA